MEPTSPFPRLTGTAEVSVRPARPQDAAAIARVQLVTWRTAYRTVLPREVLDGWDEHAATDTWRAAAAAPPTPAHGVLVALERDTVVGFAAYGPPDPADDDSRPTTEVATLLVEPRWGRRGHGSRLLAAVADLALAGGSARLQTWLPEQDAVSGGFFESAGWGQDGWVRTLDTGGTPLREVRWHALLEETDGSR
ncbi:N-acetyltransferase [Geodermatophilus sp. TF02-6]|uniref:GNAT family N-acetyltransferase n=1 Tax=Geodermatophilus sp. TF02-6 TaxID=2250575 RepID=UPI000DEA09AE|nr:GNAT family N-acetyltransferase [Geodermatophilus sp. TF02-6]RBY80696.1 N-acetyltransferase [Geodermatophilus sp. TF02-6]